ncbi:(2Fe-2S)-binding protein [Nostoc sp.]|uniref:(2Fe-2S)-binding protein n=1 Tax=Nostoc sp. TaxID=1180 RepID=UPI002FF4CD08
MEENLLAPITSNSLTQELKILGSEEVDLSLKINNVSYTLKLEPRVTLLDALREKLGLMGTKKACDRGECGACTVLVNGRRINSCMTLAVMHIGTEITTIEGLAQDGKLHPMQTAFITHDAFQCGYCTSGQVEFKFMIFISYQVRRQKKKLYYSREFNLWSDFSKRDRKCTQVADIDPKLNNT